MGKFIIKRRKSSTAKKRRNLKHRSSRVKSKTLKRRAVVKQRIPVDDGGSTTPRTAPPQDQNVTRNLADEFDDAADNSMMTLEGISANTRNLEAQSTPFMASENEIVWRNFRLQYHNIGAPAILEFYPSGRIAEEQWQINGELSSRPGNIPVIVYYADREGSPVYSETFRIETEYLDEDDEPVENVYLYTRLYFDEDGNELEETEERFEDIEGFDVDPEDFEANVGEGWRDRLVSARDPPRDSIPTLSGRTLTWKNRAGAEERRGGPAILSFFDSGRLRSEKWYVNGVYQRDRNLPNYVSYRDNSSDLTDRVEMEIWKFYNPDNPGMYGTIGRHYNNQGVIQVTLYGTESTEPGLGNAQMMSQAVWERIYGTPILVSTIPSQQTAAPQAPAVQPVAPNPTQPPNPTPSQPPSSETFYASGRVHVRGWTANGRVSRVDNYPVYVTYADNEDHTILEEDWRIESQRDPEFLGKALRSYDMSGNITQEIYEDYTEGEVFDEYLDLMSLLQSLGRPPFHSEFFGTYDYTIQGWRNRQRRVPVQQPPAPQAPQPQAPPVQVCPWDNINKVRSATEVEIPDQPRCNVIFTVDKDFKDNLYEIGRYLNDFINECNIVDNKVINDKYVMSTVKYLKKNMLKKLNVRITTKAGKEISAALKYRNLMASYIGVSAQGRDFNVKYETEKINGLNLDSGADVGGVTRIFIDSLMEQISDVLFSDIQVNKDDPYVDLYERMRKEERIIAGRAYVRGLSEKEKEKLINEHTKGNKAVEKQLFDEKKALVNESEVGEIWSEYENRKKTEIKNDKANINEAVEKLNEQFTKEELEEFTQEQKDALLKRKLEIIIQPELMKIRAKMSEIKKEIREDLALRDLLVDIVIERNLEKESTNEGALRDSGLSAEEIEKEIERRKAVRRKMENEAVVPRKFITTASEDEIRKKLNLDPKDKLSEVFELAGAMFGYAAINEIPFKIPLSRVLLKFMLSEDDWEFTDKELMANYILDSGKVLRRDMMFSTEGLDTDSEYFSSRLAEYEQSIYKNALRTYKINSRLVNFKKGFAEVGEILRQRNFTPNELNRLIYKDQVTMKDMEELLSKVNFISFDQYFDREMGSTPAEVKNIRINLMKKAILRLGEDKYRQLLRWWSGTSSIVKGQTYKIDLMNTTEQLPGTNEYVPQSFFAHTCFFTFDVGVTAVLKYPDNVKLAMDNLAVLKTNPSTTPMEIESAESMVESEINKHIDEIALSLSNEIKNIRTTKA